jgi:hypothetical protein
MEADGFARQGLAQEVVLAGQADRAVSAHPSLGLDVRVLDLRETSRAGPRRRPVGLGGRPIGETSPQAASRLRLLLAERCILVAQGPAGRSLRGARTRNSPSSPFPEFPRWSLPASAGSHETEAVSSLIASRRVP